MGFYVKEPVDLSKIRVYYLWTGFEVPGVFIVNVEGDAPNYSYGFDLIRDPHFVGGLKIDSMGWTGPLDQGTSHYKVNGSFPGEFRSKIVISGSNGDFLINVEEVPHDQVDKLIKRWVEVSKQVVSSSN